MLYFIPHNPTPENEFSQYVLIKELPTVGGILGLIEVEGEIDPNWEKLNCVFYKDGVISYEPLSDYAAERAAAYPTIQEQLDMQYWDSINGTTVWADTIAQIKADFPKPE